MLVDVKIPDISENVTQGTVVSIHVQVGDGVEVDDVLIELETDKAVVEIPSSAKGVVEALLVSDGEEIQVGAVIARINTAAEPLAEEPPQASLEAPPAEASEPVPEAPIPTAQPPAPGSDSEPKRMSVAAQTETPPAETTDSAETAAPVSDSGHSAPAAPSVRRLARELGVALDRVAASGPGGHLTAADVKAFARGGHMAASAASGPTPAIPDFSAFGPVETMDLTGIRKITAANMATAWQTVPHVTQFDEADVTEVEAFIKQKAASVERLGGKLTVTAVLAKVVAAALGRYPYFNASIDTAAAKVVLKKYIHLGVAVATEHGLLVPVVRDIDQKSISQIAIEIVDLAGRARRRKVQPRELEGATFTISNQGGIGGSAFTPIVPWPQVAILGISRTALRQRPVGEGDSFAPRRMLPLALSYDHRLIDGADAARFLRWVCEALEAPLNLILDTK